MLYFVCMWDPGYDELQRVQLQLWFPVDPEHFEKWLCPRKILEFCDFSIEIRPPPPPPPKKKKSGWASITWPFVSCPDLEQWSFLSIVIIRGLYFERGRRKINKFAYFDSNQFGSTWKCTGILSLRKSRTPVQQAKPMTEMLQVPVHLFIRCKRYTEEFRLLLRHGLICTKIYA